MSQSGSNRPPECESLGCGAAATCNLVPLFANRWRNSAASTPRFLRILPIRGLFSQRRSSISLRSGVRPRACPGQGSSAQLNLHKFATFFATSPSHCASYLDRRIGAFFQSYRGTKHCVSDSRPRHADIELRSDLGLSFGHRPKWLEWAGRACSWTPPCYGIDSLRSRQLRL